MDISTDAQFRFDVATGKLFSLFLFLQAFNIIVKTQIQSSFIDSYLTIFIGVFYLVILLSKLKMIKIAVRKIVDLEVVFFCFMSISICLNTSIASSIFGRCIWTLAFCIPLSVLYLNVENIELSMQQVKWSSIVISLMAILPFRSYIASGISGYNMAVGYLLLFPLIANFYFAKEKKFFLLFSAIDFLIIVILGSRGPLLCLFVFAFFYLLQEINTKKGFLLILTICVVLVLFLFYKNQVIQMLANLLNKFGLYSRTLTKIISGTMGTDSGRSEIWNMVTEKIKQKPIFGWGVCGELNFMTSYPHQIYLEILLHYGVVLGGIVCLMFTWVILKALLNINRISSWWTCFLATGFVPLFISGTYLQFPEFWILIALSLNVSRPYRKITFLLGNNSF